MHDEAAPELAKPQAIDPTLMPLVRSLAASGGAASSAQPLAAEVRRAIADFLAATELLNLVTVGEHGWPVTHCMHFANYLDGGNRPIVYMFTHDGKRKMANIAANPRVSMTLFNPRHELGGRMPYLRLQAVAKIVTDANERELAMQGQFNKANYEFARYIGLETQPALRADVVSAIWSAGIDGEPEVHIDYREFIEGAA